MTHVNVNKGLPTSRKAVSCFVFQYLLLEPSLSFPKFF